MDEQESFLLHVVTPPNRLLPLSMSEPLVLKVLSLLLLSSLDVTLSQLGRGRRTEPPEPRDDEQEDYRTTMTSPSGHYVPRGQSVRTIRTTGKKKRNSEQHLSAFFSSVDVF